MLNIKNYMIKARLASCTSVNRRSLGFHMECNMLKQISQNIRNDYIQAPIPYYDAISVWKI
jgi:hypothetical protein